MRRDDVAGPDRGVGGRTIDERRDSVDRPGDGRAAPHRADALDTDLGVVVRGVLDHDAVGGVRLPVRTTARHGSREELARHAGRVGADGGGEEGEEGKEHGTLSFSWNFERLPERYLQP